MQSLENAVSNIEYSLELKTALLADICLQHGMEQKNESLLHAEVF